VASQGQMLADAAAAGSKVFSKLVTHIQPDDPDQGTIPFYLTNKEI